MNDMEFKYHGKTYRIEFQRKTRPIVKHDNVSGLETFEPGRYPDTTVRLVIVGPGAFDKAIFREATVGCWHKEKGFSLEKGRIAALRLVTAAIDKEMRPLLWKAYHTRAGRRQGLKEIPKQVLVSSTIVKD
jgi:hypothetical protein